MVKWKSGCLVLLVLGSTLFGVNYTWVGGSAGAFNVSSNWTPSSIPGSGDTITFTNPVQIAVNMGTGGTVSQITANGAHAFLNSGTLTISNPTGTTFNIGNGSSFNVYQGALNLSSPSNYTAEVNSTGDSSGLIFVNTQANSQGSLTVTNGGGVSVDLGFGDSSSSIGGLSNFRMPVTIANDPIIVSLSTPFPATLTNNSTLPGIIETLGQPTTYSQTLAGTAGYIIVGQIIFTGVKSYSGDTQIYSSLTLNTSLPNSAVTIGLSSILQGTGSVGSTLAINGQCIPGGPQTAGTLTVSGVVTMGNNGQLTITVQPTANGKLRIDQNVAFNINGNGTLYMNFRPGVHEQSSYTVVSSQGAVNGQFNTFSHNVGPTVTLTPQYTTGPPGSIVVAQSGPHIRHTVPISSLHGNDRIMGEYMFGNDSFVLSNRDLINVANAVLSESAYYFREALVRLSPLATAGSTLLSLQNNLQMAVVLDKQYKDQQAKVNMQNHPTASNPWQTPLYATPNTGFFVEPIFIFVDQRQVDGSITNLGQVPYKAYTYGAGMGWEKVWNDCLVLETGVGYTHSNLDWSQNFGNARWSTVYVAPFLGWFNNRAYGNGMIMGAANFHWNNRVIAFPGFARQARSTYQSYDILLRFNGGFRQYLGREWWFQPDGTLNYLTALTSAYTETGAGSVNLSVRSRQSYILQPSLRAIFIREMFRQDWYFAPKLYVGWLANVLLKRDNITARFNGAPNQILFTIQGYYKTINQLVLGAEMYVLKYSKFTCTAAFEADLLSKLGVYTTRIKLEWLY